MDCDDYRAQLFGFLELWPDKGWMYGRGMYCAVDGCVGYRWIGGADGVGLDQVYYIVYVVADPFTGFEGCAWR